MVMVVAVMGLFNIIRFTNANVTETHNGKYVILYSYHPKHLETFGKSIQKLDENFNCNFNVPVFVYLTI